MSKFEITDSVKGKVMIDIRDVERIYEDKFEDNHNATAVRTYDYVYYVHDSLENVLGLYFAAGGR